ncbi:MAG: acyl-CoA thioesterase [Cyanobacteria bacterium NC_groundwater_1444_Ag_S-0.65um_54_12]|nr:acyl-CoA thioesterase [Cyanobacteria bacterium NC_groundwater_1444_Ag_S-0.65um_54_12]
MEEITRADHLAIRVILLPKDTNEHGTIFGGVILSYIDLAGGVEARRNTDHPLVTVALREVIFKQPVYVGDIISFYTSTRRLGRTSITVRIRVEAQRHHNPLEIAMVTTAEAVFVAIDEQGRPVPLS